MTLLGIIIFLVIFFLGYFTLDAWHDVIMKKDKDYAVKAAKEKTLSLQQDYKDLSLKYNKRWHLIDSIIKGYVVAALTFAFTGFSWWVLIFFYNGLAIRWFWFDLNWNWFAGMMPFYTGTVAKTDKAIKSPKLMIAVKVFMLLLGIGLIWWNYNSLPI